MAKTVTLTVKVNPEDKEAIKEQAEMLGLTVSKYLYILIFGDQEA